MKLTLIDSWVMGVNTQGVTFHGTNSAGDDKFLTLPMKVVYTRKNYPKFFSFFKQSISVTNSWDFQSFSLPFSDPIVSLRQFSLVFSSSSSEK